MLCASVSPWTSTPTPAQSSPPSPTSSTARPVLSDSRNQRERIESYLSLLEGLLTSPNVGDLTAFGRHFTTSTTVPLVVGRRVLGAFVAALTAGLGFEGDDDEAKWATLGGVFKGREEERKAIIEGVSGDNAGWCEEQTTRLRRAQSTILQNEEDWAGAADALIRIPLEGGSRCVPKLAICSKLTPAWSAMTRSSAYTSRSSVFFSR